MFYLWGNILLINDLLVKIELKYFCIDINFIKKYLKNVVNFNNGFN